MAAAIRLANSGDAAGIAAIYRPYVEHSHFTFEESPPDEAAIARRISDPLHPWLVAEIGGRIVGYASTSAMRDRAAYRWSVETGIYIAPRAQGRGIGRQLLSSHLDALEQRGFVTAIAGIALPNEASVTLHEKLGFALSGVERGVGFKLGRWVDVGRWQRDLAPRVSAPAEPRAASVIPALSRDPPFLRERSKRVPGQARHDGPSNVNWFPLNRHRRFLERFLVRRVGVACVGDVL